MFVIIDRNLYEMSESQYNMIRFLKGELQDVGKDYEREYDLYCDYHSLLNEFNRLPCINLDVRN